MGLVMVFSKDLVMLVASVGLKDFRVAVMDVAAQGAGTTEAVLVEVRVSTMAVAKLLEQVQVRG